MDFVIYRKVIEFIMDLAKGIDPKTGKLIEEDSILNRGDIVKTLFEIKII